MKKSLLLLAILSIICLTSCDKNSDTSTYKQSKSIPFECDGSYYVKLKPLYNNLLMISNKLYSISSNSISTIDENDSIKIINKFNLDGSSLILCSAITSNNKIWFLQHIEPPLSSNNEQHSARLVLTDTLGNIDVTRDINFFKDLNIQCMTTTSDNGCVIVVKGSDNIDISPSKDYKNIIYRFNEDGDLLWQNELKNQIQINKIIENSSNEFIICGSDTFELHISAGYLAKLDKSGNLLWEKNQDFKMKSNRYSYSNIIEQPKNNYIISVTFNDRTRQIAKFGDSGAIVWSFELENPVNAGQKHCFIKSGTNDVIFCYDVLNSDNLGDIYITKINTDGKIIWKNSYGGTGNETFSDVYEIPSVGYFLIGKSDNYTGTGFYDNDKWWDKSIVNSYFIKTDFNGISCK